IQNPTLLATVVDVDAANRTFTIVDQQNQTTTMTLDAHAKIYLAGRLAYLREIKPGSQMNVTAALDGKTALVLNLVADPNGMLANKLFAKVKIASLRGLR